MVILPSSLDLQAAVQIIKYNWSSSSNTVYILNISIAKDSLGT